jgi:glycosyltransferase involved in cell wall biosynthesis
MRLSMVMIARDEADNVRPCFDTFWDHADEVVLCDTGSQDDTVGEARRYAQEHGEVEKLVVGHFKWCDDFGAARTYAHSLATGDVHAWIDLDDRVEGAVHLHTIVEQFAKRPQLGMVTAAYCYAATEPHVARFARSPVRWLNPTYEVVEPPRDVVEVGATRAVRWQHTGDSEHGRRDFDIALKWIEREPEDWFPCFAAAKEAVFPLRDLPLAHRYAARALAGAMPVEMRSFLYDVMMRAVADRGDTELAEIFARRAAAIWPTPRCCLLLARESLQRGEYDETEHWAAEAKRVTRNRTMTDLADQLAAAAGKRRCQAALAMLSAILGA